MSRYTVVSSVLGFGAPVYYVDLVDTHGAQLRRVDYWMSRSNAQSFADQLNHDMAARLLARIPGYNTPDVDQFAF